MTTEITTPFGTLGAPAISQSPDAQTITNTCPGTLLTSDAGLVFEVAAQSVAANGSVALIQLPAGCLITGTLFYELWLGDGGYMCGQEMCSVNSGLKTITNMAVASSGDPAPQGLAVNYAVNPFELVLATTGAAFTVTGGRVLFMGMMYSNP